MHEIKVWGQQKPQYYTGPTQFATTDGWTVGDLWVEILRKVEK